MGNQILLASSYFDSNYEFITTPQKKIFLDTKFV